MVAPAVIVLVLVLLYPAFVALQTSFYKVATITRQETFVGLQNYRAAWRIPCSGNRCSARSSGPLEAMISQMVVGIAGCPGAP